MTALRVAPRCWLPCTPQPAAPQRRTACTGSRQPQHALPRRASAQVLRPRASGTATAAAKPENAAAAPLDVVCFTLIVDDIVYPDGVTAMARLGGGGPQTCFGLRLHPSSPRVGLAAGVGADLPGVCTAWLHAAGVDTAGLTPLPDTPTPRAWQVLEADGRRTQVWRTPHEPATLRPALAALPPAFRAAGGFHLGVHPNQVDLAHLAQLRAAAHASPAANAAPRGGLLSIEPFTTADTPLSAEQLRAFCSAAHVVSPNEAEAVSMVGAATPMKLVARLAAAGAQVVTLRRGPEGAIVHRADTGETWDVPAVAGVEAVDPTGCGNAFCGGFLAAWRAGEPILEAGLWGCVAASFMLECQAVPMQPPQTLNAAALERVAALRSRAKRLA